METTLSAHKLGQILDQSFRMTLKNYGRFFLPIALYSALSTALLEYMFASNREFFTAAANSPEAAMSLLDQFALGPYFLSLAVILMISPLFQYILSDLSIKSFFIQEYEWTFTGSVENAMRRYLPMLGALILSALLFSISLFALLIGSLVTCIYMSLFIPILVYEECTAWNAIKRSFELIRGNFWQMAGYWLVFALIFIGIDLVSAYVVELTSRLIGGEGEGWIFTLFYYLLNLPFLILTLGFQHCFTTNMYFNQRIKKEGFGLE
jgi:hypothetical protein